MKTLMKCYILIFVCTYFSCLNNLVLSLKSLNTYNQLTSFPDGQFLVIGKKFSFAKGAFNLKIPSKTSVSSMNFDS